ncbi:MAG: AsmA family protein [Acidobacteriota bacterium]|nr:AsmA family protein [Acidobacteriota bacterium]
MAIATEEKLHTKPATRRWAISIAVIVLAVLCIGGIILAFHWPFSSQKVIESVQEDWPGKISVQHFDRTYFPRPGCILDGVTLTRGAETSGPPLVAIRRVTIKANYHDMFFRPGYVSSIVLEGLKISVLADQPEGGAAPASQQASNSNQTSKSGNSSVHLGEVFTRDATLEIATKSDGPLKFDIHELALKSINDKEPMSYDLAMHNPEPPGEIRSRGKLGPWDSNHLDNIPLSGTYTFDKADLGVYGGIAGILSAKGEFQGRLGKIETQGATEIPNFEVTRSHHSILLKAKYVATVDATDGDTILHSVDGAFLHTSVHVEGAVASKRGKSGKTTTLNLAVRDGRIDDVLRVFVHEPKPPMEGSTSFHARVAWPSGHQPFLKRVTLQGDFAIENARWENPERQANLNDLSKRASGNKKDAGTPDITADLKGSVQMKDAIATFKDTVCKIPGAEATLNGTYNLENTKIDFHGNLKTDAELSKESTGAKAVLLKPLDPLFKRKHAGAVVPVALTGTYHDPRFGISLTGK